jgi:hypothetical protein
MARRPENNGFASFLHMHTCLVSPIPRKASESVGGARATPEPDFRLADVLASC